MSHSGLRKFIRIGQQADPVILDALSREAPADFKPALRYHFEVAGERMRAAMLVLSCAAAGGKIERAIKPAAVVEMIHNYSLVMDDLIDRGEIRRGRPTVRVVMGDSMALLVAMFYREVLDDLIKDSPASDKIRNIAVRTMKEIIDGERLDLLLEQAGRTDSYLIRNRISSPSFKLYLDMVGKKTACLFKAAGQMGAYVAQAESRVVDALGNFGWKAGLAFQIMDDVLDICGTETGKQQSKDIIEHKLGNAAILVAMRFLSRRERLELKKIIGSERVSKKMVTRARIIVNKTPAERDCKQIAMSYLEDAKTSLSILKPSSSKDDLASLADQIVARSY